jgi:hypothetical protein
MSEQDDRVTVAGLVYQQGMTDSERMVWAAAFALEFRKNSERVACFPPGSQERAEAIKGSSPNAARGASAAVFAFRLVTDSTKQDRLDIWSPVGAMAYIMGEDEIVEVIRAAIKKAEEEIGEEDDE